ncbi:IS4 family transposase ISShfr1 [Legionella sp. PC1000]|uniref:IS4 family transposase n=1 Tax=Legionella sp. PC1000 TaxID=2746060 RepID=UPI0015FCF179|nr:IS4 family transposase [Legionella sp. PC1000]QLZ68972.1 IS4 family transposase ISShfr1 [Legionella sp. PC1000]QLZ70597.1 IS4 family transposase ISShfr1 [Legionella sp. PC1000]
MQVTAILATYLTKVMRKSRLKTLSVLVESLFHAKFFSLTGLGRALITDAQERSSIRRVDRFLGNKKLQNDRLPIYDTICRLIVGGALKPLIIVDWSTIPNQSHNVLRAALVASGRALTIYEEVHPEKKYTNPKVHIRFLMKLKLILDAEVKPIIITDAGFATPWFKAVQGLGWDYVGRIRGNKYYRLQNSSTWSPITGLHKAATATPTLLGDVELCKDHGFKTTLYRYKGKALGRKNKSKRGQIKQTNQSKKHAKSNREPWLLVSSLLINSKTAIKVVEIYSLRMQIEEGFRDLKSTKYGFGFEHVNTQHIYRLNIFFLIAMLSAFLAWIVGWVAEKINIHRQYQANSIKNMRILSLFYLGCRIILKDKVKIENASIRKIIDDFPDFSVVF